MNSLTGIWPACTSVPATDMFPLTGKGTPPPLYIVHCTLCIAVTGGNLKQS